MTDVHERYELDWYPDEEPTPAAREVLLAEGAVGWHPAANLLPMMTEAELDSLTENIRQHGLNNPITVYEGMILDGRNRWLACQRAGVKPRTVEWDGTGGSPLEWVLSENVERRHLTTSQRAMIGAEMVPLMEEEARKKQAAAAVETNAKRWDTESLGAKLHQATETDEVAPQVRAPRSTDKAAAAVGVSSRSVASAKAVVEKAPALAEQVRAGTLSLGAAAHQVRTEEKRAKAAEQVKETPHVDVRLEVGDATKLALDDASVDVILTSPPYGLEVQYTGYDDPTANWQAFMRFWLKDAYRVTKAPGRLILNVPLDTTKGGYRATWPQAYAAATAVGWTYRTAILWDKGNSTKGHIPLGSEDSADAPHPVAEVEVIGLFSKGPWKLGDDRPSTIDHDEFKALSNGLWRLSGETHGWEGHPAPFPEELVRRLLAYLTRAGDVVLDPFSGSGTTALVAWRMKRTPIGIDSSEEYVASAKRRIAREQERLAREEADVDRVHPGLFATASW